MNDSPDTEIEDTAPVEAGGQAEGITFALQSIARSREAAKRAKDKLNATREINENAIFLPDTRQVPTQAKAHSAILSYYGELVKEPYINKINAHGFVEQPYTTVQVPEITLSGGDAVIELEPDPYGVHPDTPDFSLKPVQVSLATLSWWSMQFVTIKKRQRGSWGDVSEETEQKKIVLPPKAIDETYERLDELASRMNILLQVQELTPHGST